MEREDGRSNEELRNTKIARGVLRHAEGSAIIELGNTKVICAASVEESVPPFLVGSGRGWVTAEYSMLPRATAKRTRRDASTGRISGRTQEIQRIIGRALRACIDLSRLGERTIIVDCDVVEADGGTRTASITGGFVALYDAVQYLVRCGVIAESPITDFVAAVSVGIVDGEYLLDLDYGEDSRAEVDLNVAMNESGGIIEIQGTAEGKPFSREQLIVLTDLAHDGILKLIGKQKEALWE
jgi:ribonuclease PH